MFLLIDNEGFVRYLATTDTNGNPDAIHTRLNVDKSESSISEFFRIMPEIEDYSLVDIENEAESMKSTILSDMKESDFDINIKSYNFESEVVF